MTDYNTYCTSLMLVGGNAYMVTDEKNRKREASWVTLLNHADWPWCSVQCWTTGKNTYTVCLSQSTSTRVQVDVRGPYLHREPGRELTCSVTMRW